MVGVCYSSSLWGVTMLKVKILVETDELTTARAAAEFLGIHFTTVYRWIKAGKLFAFPIGGVDYIHTSEVQALKDKMKEAQEVAP